MRVLASCCAAAILVVVPHASSAWVRLQATTFATLPSGSPGPEGLEVDPDGNVYASSFGFTPDGPVTGDGVIWVFHRSGRLLRTLHVKGSSPHLLGLHWRESTRTLLVADFGAHRVLEVDPASGNPQVFFTAPAAAGLNDITEDREGNVYVSDSFLGVVYKARNAGDTPATWASSELLKPHGVPPFGANGLRFNHDESAMFVANTADDKIIRIPVSGGVAGDATVFTNGINGADGLIVDDDDNLWVAANQEDEIVVVDPTGRAIAKLGDFDGVDRHGSPVGFLFPASLRFARGSVLVTNLVLDLRLFDPSFVSIDSDWVQEVARPTIARIPAVIPRLERHDRDHDR